MTTRLLARMWRSLGAAPAVLLCVASFAYCQEPLPAPAGGTAVADEYRAKLAEWIPQLSAEPESSRYAPRMAVLAFSAAVSAPGAEDRRVLWEQELLAALQREDTPQPSRVWLVRQLEIAGNSAVVPLLKILSGASDGEVRDAARRALEANGSAEASPALRELLAAAETDDDRRSYVQSLGVRGDEAAAEAIVPFLNAEAEGLRSTAAVALGRIASPPAVEALLQAYDAESEKESDVENAGSAAEGGSAVVAGHFRRELAEALFRAMSLLQSRGRQEEAIGVGRRLYDYGEPAAIRASALRALVEADAASAEDLVIIALQSRDSEVRRAAIQSCRAYPGNRVLPNLLAVKLGQEEPGVQMQMLAVLRDARETTVSRRVGQLVQGDGPEEVRAAAAEVLGVLGGMDAVEPLLARLAKGERQIRRRTLELIAAAPGQGVELALLEATAEGEPELRAAAVSALAARGAEGLDRRLLGWAREENPVREAALQALEARGGADVFIVLADLCVERGEESDFAALGAVARRMENRDEATRMIAERLASAPAERKDGLFSVLAQVGGAAGLDVVKPLLADAAQRAGAIQALADWSSADACPLILETAVAEGTSEEENVRLLQGLARLVREGRELGADARRGYALGGLNASRRDEERRSMLSLLAAAPHAESVAAILPHLQAEGSAIKEEAAAALVEIAAKLKESDGETAKGALEAVQSAAVSDDVKQRAAEVSSGG